MTRRGARRDPRCRGQGADLFQRPEEQGNNIGAPAQPDEIDRFLVMLRTTKQHATDADLATIEQELRLFAKPYQRPAPLRKAAG
jgi:hypothetical protein